MIDQEKTTVTMCMSLDDAISLKLAVTARLKYLAACLGDNAVKGVTMCSHAGSLRKLRKMALDAQHGTYNQAVSVKWESK